MAQGPQVEVDDAIVLLLGAPTRIPSAHDHIEGVTRLEKLIFLLERETPLGDALVETPDFRAHNFGPFSSKIYQSVNILGAAGILRDSASLAASSEDAWETEEVIGEVAPDPYATRNFELTERGRRYYTVLSQDLPEEVTSELAAFKDRFCGLPLRQLVRYVYERYPDYTTKSLIRDDILGS